MGALSRNDIENALAFEAIEGLPNRGAADAQGLGENLHPFREKNRAKGVWHPHPFFPKLKIIFPENTVWNPAAPITRWTHHGGGGNMADIKLKRLIGRILLVQEDRFRLVGRTGKGYLFSMSHNARAGSRDLQQWRRANFHVLVRFSGEPNLKNGIAYSVEPWSPRERNRRFNT